MKRWLYVQCEIDPTGKLLPSFAHRFVQADCDDDAYLKGARYFDKHPTRLSQQRYLFLNDYVVLLP